MPKDGGEKSADPHIQQAIEHSRSQSNVKQSRTGSGKGSQDRVSDKESFDSNFDSIFGKRDIKHGTD